LASCASAFGEIGASEIEASLKQLIAEMPDPSKHSLRVANDLITERHDYTYEAIEAAVAKRVAGTPSTQPDDEGNHL
jgi:hypothetical protein